MSTEAEADPAKKPRRPNPHCLAPNCSHPLSFHPYNKVAHRRKCTAFGCKCKGYQKPVEA